MAKKPKIPPGIRERKGRFQIRFRDGSGKQRAESFATLSEAKTALSAARTDVQRGDYLPPSDQTFEDYSARWLKLGIDGHRFGPQTAVDISKQLRNQLLPRVGHLRMQDLAKDRTRLQELLVELRATGSVKKGPLSPARVRAARTVLAMIFRDAENAGIAASPFTNGAIRIPKDDATDIGAGRIKVYTREEMRMLFDATRLPKYQHLSLAVTLAFRAGLRVGEIAALRARDADLKNGKLSVEVAAYPGYDRDLPKGERRTWALKPPKSKSSRRTIALDAATVAAFEAHLRILPVRPIGDAQVLTRPSDGKPWFPADLSKAFTVMADEVGIKGRSIHCARHTHATILLEEGMSPSAVAKRLGHADASITLKVYSHATGRAEEAILRVLDSIAL